MSSPFACTHDEWKQSLVSFLDHTTVVGWQILEGEVQYLANCKRCHSTLAVVLDLARGHVARGEIETGWQDSPEVKAIT